MFQEAWKGLKVTKGCAMFFETHSSITELQSSNSVIAYENLAVSASSLAFSVSVLHQTSFCTETHHWDLAFQFQ